MTSISRRSFLAVAAASGAAALSNTVSAQEKPNVSEKFKDYPAGAKSAAKYPALPEPLPDLSLTETFSLGKSPLNEGSCITACHWGIVRPQVRGGKMVALHPFEYDYAPSQNINGLCNLPYSASRIHYPMVRESYLKDGPASREKRGTDRWVRVSWDQALDLVANELKRIYPRLEHFVLGGVSYERHSSPRVSSDPRV